MTAMTSCFDGSSKSGGAPNTPPPKKIYTPAGHRLSSVLAHTGGANTPSVRTRDSRSIRASLIKGAAMVETDEIAVSDAESQDTPNYTFGVFSMPKEHDGFSSIYSGPPIKSNNKKKRVLIIIAICVLIALIIALGAGLGVSLSKNKKSSESTGEDDSELVVSRPTKSASTAVPNPKPTTATGDLTDQYPNFPVGAWKSTLSLDTIQENCTAIAHSWQCPPGTIFNQQRQGSHITFNWKITGDNNNGFMISGKAENHDMSPDYKSFAIDKVKLDVVGEGTDQERYFFRVQMSKSVTVMQDIIDHGTPLLPNMTCMYRDTTYQALFYTRMEKDDDQGKRSLPSIEARDDELKEWPKGMFLIPPSSPFPS